ncbi:hypothetical protein AcW1_005354 [Taiwanofungus camphoratus]|nr:hypothetical protein AcW1_005354 [Antrodia cinnamomea]
MRGVSGPGAYSGSNPHTITRTSSLPLPHNALRNVATSHDDGGREHGDTETREDTPHVHEQRRNSHPARYPADAPHPSRNYGAPPRCPDDAGDDNSSWHQAARRYPLGTLTAPARRPGPA